MEWNKVEEEIILTEDQQEIAGKFKTAETTKTKPKAENELPIMQKDQETFVESDIIVGKEQKISLMKQPIQKKESELQESVIKKEVKDIKSWVKKIQTAETQKDKINLTKKSIMERAEEIRKKRETKTNTMSIQ